MKLTKHILGTLLFSALTFTSCSKDDNKIDELIIRPTAEEFNGIQDAALDNITQHFQFNADDGNIYLTSENGVDIYINATCLMRDGNAVTGTVDLEYVEIFNKGHMLTTNKPTMGMTPDGDKALLISGGEFFVEASQNGEPLDTNCGFQLTIPGNLTGSVDNDMTLWNGTIDNDGNLAWDEIEQDGTDENGKGRVFGEGNNYYAFIGDFGWSNVDRFYSDPRPKTTILASVPEGYDNTNCAIYLSYDGEDTGLANLDTYDDLTELFSEHYGLIPVGLECHAIFVSEEGDDWKYAIKSVTIVENDIIEFTESDMAIITESQLTDLINALP